MSDNTNDTNIYDQDDFLEDPSKELDSTESDQDFLVKDYAKGGIHTVLQGVKKEKNESSKRSVAKIIEALCSDNTNRAIKLLQTVKAAKTNSQVQEYAKEALARKIAKTGDISSALHIAKSFFLPKNIVIEGVCKGLEECSLYLFVDAALRAKEMFELPLEFLQEVAYKKCVEAMSIAQWESRVDKFKEAFNLKEEEFKKAGIEGVWNSISSGNFDQHIKIFRHFNLATEDLQYSEFVKAAKIGIVQSLSRGEIHTMRRIYNFITGLSCEAQEAESINLDDPEFIEAAKKGILKNLACGEFDKMKKIQNDFHISSEMLEQSESTKAAKEGMTWKFIQGEIDTVMNIKNEYACSEEDVATVDTYVVKHISVSTLIKYIPHLSNEKALEAFPQTFEKIITLLQEEIPIQEDLADYFLEKLHEFYTKSWAKKLVEKSIEHYSVAKKFVLEIEKNNPIWSQEKWVEDFLKKAKKNIGHSSENIDGFLEEDPFKGNPIYSTKSSIALTRIMQGKGGGQKEGLNLSKNTIQYLQEINEVIMKEYNNFLASLESSSCVPEEDKKALMNQEDSNVKMNNLLPNVQNFVGRYLIQLAKGNLNSLNSIIRSEKDSIQYVVADGFNKYLQVYEVDIPLYDKLYEEFDNWREAGRYPMEVYLGRDGIYAYIGRKAQDAARQSKTGKEKREALRSEGEIVEIHPRYVVYPRHFRDKINYDTKHKFLEQNRISPDTDPLFYDTGYTGTIPEQIMEIMGFSHNEIEERIRLLSAESDNRRVKGIPENARNEIIEHIEHNSKLEESAIGLVQDKATGKITHVARPTSPIEQFNFMMIKQAIARHYMIKERLNFKAPENRNYDSENYYIRVHQDYADILPKEFIENPNAFLKERGTLLKGSHGDGEFPDEEIISFSLEDGTEIISKKIEIKKSKQSRKEFAILIAAKKVGLETAKAVGYLSGKTQDDGSYLLMEKIEGFSGRKFEKYLQETHKYSTEKINDIMKVVFQKLQDIAQIFRDRLNIDKHWRVKDTIIQFNEQTGEVENVIPIDWERAKTYNPDKPQKIDEVQ